ncbi:nuclear pore complex protein Nup160 homolog isoform X1 [Anopheles darlingi]|uniref:nuclear pore complex protein Nup160 homolog isoform X1 n=1 Tax=Anopheles darlingi TaxID=43151 RepID=UPI0021003D8A|nr:nuclear pore complex protein Nup160 homolog isoform X1 [Anopheles darlingi]
MACATVVKYREVPLLQHQIVKNSPKSIKVSSGGYHTMLVDSKTSEISGGFSFAPLSKGRHKQTPFIYWRTLRETIYLTETCLHRNDVCHEVKITFEGSPIIAVAIHAHSNVKAFLLITTTTSFHRIPIDRPMHGDHQMHVEQDSILLKLNENVITDPLNCYTFINDVGQSLPVTASAIHCPEFNHTKFAIATVSSLHLFTMELGGEKTIVKFVELEHKPLSISKFINTIADSWRGKSHTSQVVTMCFGTAGGTNGHPLLYTLHRDGALRVWLHCGRFIAAEYLSKYTQGSETEFHSCVLRGSNSLVALYFSFQTFSEFIILRPEGTKDSLVLRNAGTIMAPNFDLIDFKLTDRWLWALWCNAEGEMQTLAYALTADERLAEKDANVWLPVVLENATESELPVVDAGTDMRDLYCNRIFHSGLFPDKVIRKTLTMFNRNLAGVVTGGATGSTMVRLKRYVLACIESQLQQERSNIRQNTPLDDEQLLELSNGLWEKFYLYCTQYSYESSRPVGLFLLEEAPADIEELSTAITVGIVRKKYISFFRPCDPLEVAYYTPPLAEVDDYDAGVVGSGATELLSGEVVLLINFLREMDQTFSPEQKHELDSYIHQRRGNKGGGDDLSAIGAAQNQELIHSMMPAFLQRMEDLPGSIGLLLRYLKPADQRDDMLGMIARESENHVRISTGEGLASELALVTTKQMIQLRYLLLRNLLLLQHIVQHHANLSYDLLDPIQSTYRPDTETMLRCYHVMNWIAQTRIDLDWTKTTKIAASFPLNLRTSMSLLQAYAISRLNDETLCGVREFSVASCESSIGDALPFLQKSNLIISYICPSSDDFLFGEWLSDNDLHVLIDEYVRLLSHWCEWNCCSRNFIQAKSYLMLGDTAKALDLFPLSLKGIQNERFLQKFLRQGDKNRNVSPYEMLGAFYLRLIRLFEYYGAYDGVMTLVHSAIDSTIQQKQQAMFQSIEFSSHIELGHYEEAYNALTKNCEPARKKDCLRQLICLLFSVRRLDILMDLPYYGLEEEFTNIVAMNARSADIADGVQYDFLYSFFTNKQNLRKAAITAYEEAMRNYAECNSYDHLNRYYGSLLKCLNSLAIINPRYAWILRPLQENHRPQQLTSNSEDRIQIVEMKDLEEQLMSTHCALQLSQSSDGFKVVTSLEPIGLIALLLSRKLYHLASKLAHCRAPSMVPTVYEHLCSSCLAINGADPAIANNTISWLNENCISDVPVGPDTASTAWNYLRHMLTQESPEHATDSYLAVLNRVLSRGAYAPTWLKDWCFEHMPSKLIRAYLSHGRLEEAYEQTVELFQARFFSTGRFSHQTLFPLTVCEHLVYELEQAANYPKEKDHIERYLRMIEVTL